MPFLSWIDLEFKNNPTEDYRLLNRSQFNLIRVKIVGKEKEETFLKN